MDFDWSIFRAMVHGQAVKKVFTVSGVSGTYQSATADRNKLHVFVSPVACVLEHGTGASVTVTNKVLVPGGQTYEFSPSNTPNSAKESLGYATLSGDAFSATEPASIYTKEAV